MKNNEGFTLIELIVVIAIIAVLAVVLAPQYIQYVERGRESNDVQIAQNLMDAASIAAADPAISNPAATYTIILREANGAVALRSADAPTGLATTDAFYKAFVAVVGTDNQQLQSVNGQLNDLIITVNTITGDVTWSDDEDPAVQNTGWSALLD